MASSGIPRAIDNELRQLQPNNHHQAPQQPQNERGGMSIWSRFTFQKVFTLFFIRLLIYLNKIYEDYGEIQTYHKEKNYFFELISLLCFLLPPIVYAIYEAGSEWLKNERVSVRTILTKIVSSFLLIFWQLKRHLDAIFYSVQNLFFIREARADEKEQLFLITRKAETLEFFEDFYAGFIQVAFQLYILLNLRDKNEQRNITIIKELIASGLAIFSMLVALRRRDDGWFTRGLSYLGWSAIFVSRSLVFALAMQIIGNWIFLICAIHVLCYTIFVWKISRDALEEDTTLSETQRAKRKGFLNLILVFFFFGLPSLVMWPYMFHLKQKGRPFIFLLVIFVENILLISLWFFIRTRKEVPSSLDYYLAHTIIPATLLGAIALSLYFYCKPSLVDQVVLYDMRYSDTDSYGMYFEFFDTVFNLNLQPQFRETLEAVRQQPELFNA